MGFIAKDTGTTSNFKRVPPGVYVARCYSLIDMGTQLSTGQYENEQHKIRLGFEIFGDDDEGNALTVDMNGKEMPLTISKTYTLSLHKKSALRKDLAAWRGVDFTEEEAAGFNVQKLMGQYCMVNVTEKEENDKKFTNIVGITPLPKALKNAKPAPVHDSVMFDLDEPDWNVFQHFHPKLQESIKKSPEFAVAAGNAPLTEDAPF